MYHEKTYCWMNLFSTKRRVEQIEVIQAVASLEVSRPNHTVMNKDVVTSQPKISHRLMVAL